jgi:hypothetical protein
MKAYRGVSSVNQKITPGCKPLNLKLKFHYELDMKIPARHSTSSAQLLSSAHNEVNFLTLYLLHYLSFTL